MKVFNRFWKEALDKATIITNKLIKINFFDERCWYINLCKITSKRRVLKN